MSSGFDDFLDDLRGELERCVATEEAAATHTPARVPPWRSRTVLAWATALLVVAAVAVGAVESQTTDRPATNGLVPATGASGSTAFVLPLTPAPVTSPGGSAQPALTGYSLSAVAAHTATDAWAVGSRIGAVALNQGSDALHSLIMHWDGTAWREVSTPDIGPLTAVTVAGDGQAWAIDPYAAEALHWDGQAWTAIANDLPANGELTAITATAANDVWAVGRAADGSASPLVLHWNGLAWRAADTPAAAGPGAVLRSVSGSSSTDVSAVGSTADGQDLELYWDGFSWATIIVAIPSIGDVAPSAPSAVVATAANDVWISTGQSLQHWDGAHWRAVPIPFAAPSNATMSAVSSNDVWISAPGLQGLANWDGSTWRRFGYDEIGLTNQDNILGVAARATDDVWAVGTATPTDGSPVVPLVLHWDGVSWRVVVHAVQAQ